ncbi:hypothetical protein [Thiofilum flexile]|uniref:hypothetical protein n=1 Tax=Thiofilum flexile TaxID=125627 RepID=UPI0003660473|nr:hypothetical protein [Thiofilum flexile]
MMKINTLFTRLALATLSLPVAGQALAEDCSTSFYCYGNSVGFTAINVVVADEGGTTPINVVPTPRPVANPTPSNVPNRPLTTPVRPNYNRNNTGCMAQYNAELAKAAKLDALARAQAQRGQEGQAQRLFRTAAQIRANATRMNCR